jgi:hypothetical protein
MTLSFRLQELTSELNGAVDVPGGLFRLAYRLRNPAPGRGAGLDGIESEDLIRRYADALHRTQRLFHKWGWPEPRRVTDAEWGWPEPHRTDPAKRCVAAYVFRTTRLGEGDAPLTITSEIDPGVYASRLALRSTIDEPRPDTRDERMEIEAAHEAAHVYTHQFVAPLDVIGDLWAWFDEATAVFVEGEVFPEHREARRAGMYWSYCPELSLTAWGGFGGYFAAWFVRFLVGRLGPGLLLEVWRSAEGRFSPLEALTRVLQERGTNLPDVLWEYCWQGYDSGVIAPGVPESFGPRSLTETFTAPAGGGWQGPLQPLACRYYRILWESTVMSTSIRIETDGQLARGEVHSTLLSVAANGEILDQTPLTAAGKSGHRWHGTARRPAPPGAHTAVVVARVLPPPEQRAGAALPVTVRVLLGA